MNKVLTIVFLAVVAVQSKSIPEFQDAIVRYPELLRLSPVDVGASSSRVDGSDGKIIGGTAANSGQFPHQCWLSIKTAGGNFFCGCSVLSDTWILTAAHCAQDAFEIAVTMGDTDRTTPEGEVTFTNKTVIIHESWRPNLIRNDVAVIQIDPVTFDDKIKRICLANSTSGDFAGQPATVSGWGKTSDNSSVATQLSYIDVPVITNTECTNFFGVLSITASNICTSTAGNMGVCNGDSGGPLISSASGRLEQIGVVSFVSSNGCTAGPSAYARVSSFYDWIVSKVGQSNVC